jgi:hypothetical protein
MGLLDAEGNFQVFPKVRKNLVTGAITSYGVGYHFHLGMALRDLELVRSIQTVFGGRGKIYEYPLKPEAHYVISTLADMRWLLESVLLQYPLLTMHQASRLSQLKAGLLNNIKRFDTLEAFRTYFSARELIVYPDMTGLSKLFTDSWIVGFINGEWCFTSSHGTTGAAFEIEHTDQRALEFIKARLDVSPNVLICKVRPGRKQTYSLQITTLKDLDALISFLDSNIQLQGHKFLQYQD